MGPIGSIMYTGALSVFCPVCAAKPGYNCTRYGETDQSPHMMRVRKALREKDK